VILENKIHGLGAETNFDFKYIPDFSAGAAQGGMEETGATESGVELRNLKTLIVASATICIASWYGVKITLKMVSWLFR
jgi:hypothetical protein